MEAFRTILAMPMVKLALGGTLVLAGILSALSYLSGLWANSRGFCGAKVRRGWSRCRNFIGNGALCRVRHGGSWIFTEPITVLLIVALGLWVMSGAPLSPQLESQLTAWGEQLRTLVRSWTR